jgi:hypothetical protein
MREVFRHPIAADNIRYARISMVCPPAALLANRKSARAESESPSAAHCLECENTQREKCLISGETNATPAFVACTNSNEKNFTLPFESSHFPAPVCRCKA